jgi:predicted amidohydrolase
MTRVAAVQMHAQLGDVTANLENAERWVRMAIQEGAHWIVLPEFFTTGIALHPTRLLEAYEPLDGRPMQLLKRLAKDGNACVGGSFLARSGADVFNTFVLALPNGDVFTHDKDFPTTSIESSVYAGGEDDEYVNELKRRSAVEHPAPIAGRAANIKSGVFIVPGRLTVGTALCWEQVRYRTARRMTGRVDLVLAASGWPFSNASSAISRPQGDARVAPTVPSESVREAPRRLARLVGAPVAHANLVGDTWNVAAGAPARLLRFSGESQIVDARGRTIASRPYSDGEGLVVADVEAGRVMPTESIPADGMWTPEGPASRDAGWYVSGAAGRTAYLTDTRPRRNAAPRNSTR